MIRPAILLWAALVVAAGLLLYKVKHDVRELEEELASLNRAIVERRDRIHVLEAEWSLLNEPERLRDLATRHLALAPLRADQLARASEALPRLALAPAPGLPAADQRAAVTHTVPAAAPPASSPVLASLPLPPAFPDPPPRSATTPPRAERRTAASSPPPTPLQARPLSQPEAPAPRPASGPAAAPASPATVPANPVRVAPQPTPAPPPQQPVAPPPPRPALASALGTPAGSLPPPVAGPPR